jgi:hypothetical protein
VSARIHRQPEPGRQACQSSLSKLSHVVGECWCGILHAKVTCAPCARALATQFRIARIEELEHRVAVAIAQRNELLKALERALKRCTNCDTCGPALCSACEVDAAVLARAKGGAK